MQKKKGQLPLPIVKKNTKAANRGGQEPEAQLELRPVEGGVTAPRGFLAAGVCAGIKNEKKDMAMIYSQDGCIAAGTFTTNQVKAAPVKWDMAIVREKYPVHAVVINSKVANACTGEEGFARCAQMAKETQEIFALPEHSVLVASTGVIGAQLPMDKILGGIRLLKDALGDTPDKARQAAEAIMTTDTVAKEIGVEFELQGKRVRIGGMCKGSGMIHPNMCTMLSFLTTDVNISKKLLVKALRQDVEDTYNMISVDGDTSTNDTVLLLSSQKAENPYISEDNEDFRRFCQALRAVNTSLAKAIAKDGEGATTLLEVKVIGAKSKEQARTLSKSVVSSSLTKAAIFGRDANWGRILCAMGYAGAVFDPDKVDLYFESAAGKIQILENSLALPYSEEEATRILSEPEVTVTADIHMGQESATAWGCDLTYDYIKINADYRS